MPTVRIHELRHRAVVVKCPICEERLPRDPLAWRVHMETDHSADADSWADTGERGSAIGYADKYRGLYRYGHKCYGCGATFLTEALLVTHLDEKHSAT
jgi:hypothetical protein